jgi:RNA polymerase sigma-70 factor (ECF subfamily)
MGMPNAEMGVMQDDTSTLSDGEIIRRVLAGDVNAFEYFLIKYKDYVCNVVKKHVPYPQVEETVQEVFIRAYQSLPTFQYQSSFSHWLSTIAVRTCYHFWRQQYRSRELPMSALTEKHQEWLENVLSAQSEQSLDEQVRQKEARELLEWALARLSPEERIALELVYLEGLSGKEAAELLGWSIANVKIRTFRARQKLHKFLSRILKAEKEQR